MNAAETNIDAAAVAEKYPGRKYGSHGAFKMQHDACRRFPTSSRAGHFDRRNNVHAKGSVLR